MADDRTHARVAKAFDDRGLSIGFLARNGRVAVFTFPLLWRIGSAKELIDVALRKGDASGQPAYDLYDAPTSATL